MSNRERSVEIEATAAEWVVRVDSGSLAPHERAMLDEWLAGDNRRLGAYARARAGYLYARRAKALGPNFDPDSFLASHADDRVQSAEIGFKSPIPSRLLGRRTLLISAAGASAAVVATFGLSWPAAAQTYRTGRGEIRLFPLVDGSTVTLDASSTVTVNYSTTKRWVELMEGEALFDVICTPSRPFVVTAGDAEMRASSTSFAVRHLADTPVQVLVRQGSVEVERIGAKRKSVAKIFAGNRGLLTPGKPTAVTSMRPTEMSAALMWRVGMLSFEDVTLREASIEFARYSSTRILFENPAIGDETVTGLFGANKPIDFARSVALSRGLHAKVGVDTVTIGQSNI